MVVMSRLDKYIRISTVKEGQMVGLLKTLCDGVYQDFYRLVAPMWFFSVFTCALFSILCCLPTQWSNFEAYLGRPIS